jgi:hypothetical protein
MAGLIARTRVKAPTLAASAVSVSRIDVTATPPAGFVAATYTLQRSTDQSNWTTVGTQPGAVFQVTGLSELTTYYFRATMTDILGNASGYSGSASAVTLASTTSMRWNPGLYLGTGDILRSDDLAARVAANKAQIDLIAGNSAFKGFKFMPTWSALETAKNVYSWAEMDDLVAYCKAQTPKLRYIIIPQAVKFHGSTGTPNTAGFLPGYLATESGGEGGYALDPTGTQTRATMYTAPVMDRLIALHQAIGARYSSDPYFEGASTDESTFDFSSAPGYSNAANLAQQQRLHIGARAAYPGLNFWVQINFFINPAYCKQLLDSAYNNGCGFSGPDIMGKSGSYDVGLNDVDWYDGQKLYIGCTHNTGLNIWDSFTGNTDYRGKVACGHEIQEPDYTTAGWGLQDIWDMSDGILHNQHVIWSYCPSFPSRWLGDLKAFLEAHPTPTYTSFPSRYTALGYAPLTGGT